MDYDVIEKDYCEEEEMVYHQDERIVLPSQSMTMRRPLQHSLSRNSSRSCNRRQSSKKISTYEMVKLAHELKTDQSEEVSALLMRELSTTDNLNDYKSMSDAMLTVKQVPTALNRRRKMRNEILLRQESLKNNDVQVNKLRYFYYETSFKLLHMIEIFKDLLKSVQLWQGPLKDLEGKFGRSVVSYFLLLKFLLQLNLPMLLFVVGFIIVPQVLYRPSYDFNTLTFTGWDLLTGEGWLLDTELYYGYYANVTMTLYGNMQYNIPLAYLLTLVLSYLLCLIILAIRISVLYRNNFINIGSSGSASFFATKVLSGWDYSITKEFSAKLRMKSVYNDLQEYLVDRRQRPALSLWSQFVLLLTRILGNTFVLGVIASAVIGVIYLAELDIEVDNILVKLIMPVSIGILNMVLPRIFAFIGMLEKYENPRNLLYSCIIRNGLFKLALLTSLLYYWLKGAKSIHSKNSVVCWETIVGIEIYKLVLFDMMFMILGTAIFELFHRVGAKWFCRHWDQPEFDIANNVLDIIYSQALLWIGVFYSPFIIVLGTLKLILTFYIKKVSAMVNCSPSSKPWRPAQTSTVFMVFLFFIFLVGFIALGYVILDVSSSDNCGPFNGYHLATDIFDDIIENSDQPTLAIIWEMMKSVWFLLFLVVIISVCVVYFKTMCDALEKTARQIKQQIYLTGRDKQYLLSRLQEAQQLIRRRCQIEVLNNATDTSDVNILRMAEDDELNSSIADELLTEVWQLDDQETEDL